MQPLPELRTQASVSLDIVHKQSVSARSWLVENIQECGPRGLILVRHIAVPPDTAYPLRKECLNALVVCASVDQVDLRVTLRTTTCRMDMMPSEVAAEVKSFVNWQVCEVLSSESDHFALRDEESQLIFPSGCKATKLNPTNNSAYGGRQIVLLDVGA